MKAAIIAFVLALCLGTAFVASVSMSFAGGNEGPRGNYVDDRADGGQ